MVDNGSGTHGDGVTSGYIQDEMNLGDSFILVLGGRNDTYSTFGSKWSPKASARYLNAGTWHNSPGFVREEFQGADFE